LLESCIRQIQTHNSELNTFITVLFEEALKEAENTERRIKKGAWLGPLDGIPFSVKDIIQIKGVRYTAGSILFKDYIAKRNAIKTIESTENIIKTISIKDTNLIPFIWTIIRLAEAAEQHKRWT
jgi:Asp-tRNA(Asn)/Glu-tRNA(Gln) amidotransferase A subunit family amidase